MLLGRMFLTWAAALVVAAAPFHKADKAGQSLSEKLGVVPDFYEVRLRKDAKMSLLEHVAWARATHAKDKKGLIGIIDPHDHPNIGTYTGYISPGTREKIKQHEDVLHVQQVSHYGDRMVERFAQEAHRAHTAARMRKFSALRKNTTDGEPGKTTKQRD